MRRHQKFVVSLTCLLWAGSLVASDDYPEVTIDGLHRIPDTKLQLIYALPDTDLSQFTRIFLMQPSVNFVNGYLRAHNQRNPRSRLTESDLDDMRTALAQIFVEEFTDELQNNAGYVMVDGVAADVLAVRPAILDLDVIAPETSPNERSAVASVGSMTLYMELIDSVSGDIMVKAMDHQFDRTRARINVRNRDRNEAAARQIVRQWAVILREGLDEAHLRAGKQDES